MPVPVISGKPNVEITRVGLETEVKIPWLTYVFTSLMFSIITAGLWLAAWLIWLQRSINQMSAGRWVAYKWSPWLGRWWPLVLMSFVPCWIGLSALAYLYRLFIEQLAKSTPAYENMHPDDGIWNPLGRVQYEDDEPEPEMSVETVDVNLWDRVKQGRKRRRTLPEFLMTDEAKSFYKAVAGNARLFSERRAADFGISRKDFNEHIRDPLLARKMADWKNERNKRSGVVLLPDALRTLEVLSRQ